MNKPDSSAEQAGRYFGFAWVTLLLISYTWICPLASAARSSAITPATQPTSLYNKFSDSTTISINLAGVSVSYTYPGQEEKHWHDKFQLVLDRSVTFSGSTLIFVLDGKKRVRIDVGSDRSATVTSDWLQRFVGAKSLEVNVGDSPDGTALGPEQIDSIHSLLERAGYYSKERATAEDDRKAIWTPGKKIAFIIDSRGRMLSVWRSVQKQFLSNVLDHPAPGLTELFFAPQSDGTILMWEIQYPSFPPETFGYVIERTDFGRSSVRRNIEKLHSDGAANIPGAFDAAILQKPDAVVFVTTHSFHDDVNELSEIRAKLIAQRIPVHVLDFEDRLDAQDPTYKDLATATKGQYRLLSTESNH